MEYGATSYQSQGLVRALVILRALSQSDHPLGLGELSASLTLPKSTLVRLLSVLEREEFVNRTGDPPLYTVGHAVLEIAENFRRRANVAEVAAPYLRGLAESTGLTANVGVVEGRWVLHVCVEEPDRPLRFRSTNNSLDYTYCTGLGKMLLSVLPVERLTDHLPTVEPYTAFTEHTITQRADFEAELKRIRERGYSIDQEERDLGVICLALPIPNAGGLNVALSVAGPAGELSDDIRAHHSPLMERTAAELGDNTRFIAALTAAHGVQPLVETAS